MRLVSVKCPECGGRVSLQDGADRVKCEYCGTTSVARRRTRFFEVPVPPRQPQGARQLPVATQMHSVRWWVVLWVLFPVLIGGVFGLVQLAKQRSIETTQAEQYNWKGGNVILHDVNGDGTPDPVGFIWYFYTKPYRIKIAAFDGTNGERLWESESVSDDVGRRGTLTLAGNTVIVADDVAKLTGFSVADGTKLWTTSLPELPKQTCAGADGTVVFVTADDARHRVNATDGSVSPAPESDECKPIATDATNTGGPDAARTSWIEGDAYLPYYLDGMRLAYVLMPTQGDVRFAFGTRKEGTYVPNVAAYRVETSGEEPAPVVVWKQEVPSGNPLEAYATEPLNASVDDQFVVVAYDMKDGVHRMTCFRRADGTRVWDVPLLSDGWVFGIETTKDLVYVSDSNRLDVFSMADGSHVRSIASE